jgi:hypothetical protein
LWAGGTIVSWRPPGQQLGRGAKGKKPPRLEGTKTHEGKKGIRKNVEVK